MKQTPKDSLTKTQIKEILQSLKEDRGINPKYIKQFLALDESPTLDHVDKILPVALIIIYIVLTTLKNYLGASMPLGVTIPSYLHAFLQSVHSVFSNESASASIIDHVIQFSLEGSILWGLFKTVPNWVNLKSRGAVILAAQVQVKEAIQQGKFNYAMSKSHTAAFVGGGDKLATRLQELKPIDGVIQYANITLDKEVWQLIKSQSTQTETFAAFDRGGLLTAGEIIILPVKENDMFLPGKDGHDMTIDEIEGIISTVDDYCKVRKIPLKRAIIVGSRYMPQIYHRRKTNKEYDTSIVTLDDLAKRLSKTRKKTSTEIIDPTEVVMKKVVELAKGYSIEFHATEEGDSRYGERFCEILQEDLQYEPSKKEAITVLYDIIDTPTQIHATPNGDIAVILDSWRKEGMIKKGIKEQNIIIVPDLVLEYLSEEVEES